jgi:tetratricopeptide (TPR) repeat protein
MTFDALLLDQSTTQYNDVQWLKDHAVYLYDTIGRALANPDPRQADRGIEVILRVYPYVLPIADDLKRWTKLVYDGLAYLQAVRDREGQPDYYSFSYEYMMAGTTKSARQQFNAALRRARQRVKPRSLLEAYAALFKMHVYRHTDDFDRSLVTGLMILARMVNDPLAYAQTHQALAFMYIRWGQYDEAVDQARIGYDFWTEQNHPVEQAACAYLLASALRWQERYTEALQWLEVSSQLYASTSHELQYGLIASETSSVLIKLRQFQEARQWGEIAVAEFDKTADRYRVALARHCLGIAQTYLGDYAAAQETLGQSLSYYQERGDENNIAHLHHSMAYLEARRGSKKRAGELLDKAELHYQQTPEIPFNQQQLERIAEIRRALKKGSDLSLL